MTGGAGGSFGAGGAGITCFSGNIDLRATKVSGTITINGVVADQPTTQGEGILSLGRASGIASGLDSATLGSTATAGGAFSALVIPGIYDLYYSRRSAGTAVPVNSSAKLQSGIVIGSSPVTLNVNIPATKVSGTITVNGAAVTNTPTSGEAGIALVDAPNAAAVIASPSPTGSYAALLVPGTYQVKYFRLTSGVSLPTNETAVIKSGVVVGATPLTLDIDIPAPTVSVTVTINGGAGTPPITPHGSVSLIDTTGSRAPLTNTSAGTYSGRVAPGMYDVLWESSPRETPGNYSVKVRSGVVVGTSAVALTVDIPATSISGKVMVAGVSAGDLAFLSGQIVSLTLGTALTVTSAGTYSASVVPGTYNLYFSSRGGFVDNFNLPKNMYTTLQTGIVIGTAPLSLDISVPVATVSGTVTVNGAALTTAAQNSFLLTLKNADGDRVSIATIPTSGAFSARVISGTYDLYYNHLNDPGTVIPNSGITKLRSGIVVGTAPVTLDVDLRAPTVTGAITVNGAAAPASPDDLTRVSLLDDEGQVWTLGFASSGSYSTLVIPGTYQLYYSYGSLAAGSPFPTNNSAHLGCLVVP